ncbi:MAG: YitT family protein [Lachnospiraceae bacterium]|uniref:YitT family protein n=1 Tax=Candidatus Enterocloster excrementigallinarum TaxID=2838558 RepID=A0A9D2PTF0_9FIRM|nr:YitT family protein [Lachnospiraceae bacterium]HJC65933.1 YitT family protein [Candidatus Enterocloster excrementigallinarum]
MKIQWKQEGKNMALLLVGALIYGIGTHAFVEPAHIAPGGAMGIALMVNHFADLPIGLLTLAINIPLLVLAWFSLSHRFAVSTAFATAVCSFILDFMVAPVCPVYTGDRILCSLYGGILSGVGMGLIFMAGMTTGGSDILGYVLQKKRPQLSIGRALMAVDGVILLMSIYVFGNIDAALFGLVSLFATTKVIDSVIYGGDASTMATVVTRKPREIARRIIADLDRSATLVQATGAYSGKDTSVLLCTVRKSQFQRLRKIVYEADPGAFLMATEASEVLGDGFKALSEQS